jgi:peptide/nickel transport system permease protein
MSQQEARQYKKKNQAKEIWKRMKKNKAAMVGLVIICIFLFMAIFADVIADYDKTVIGQNMAMRLKPPSLQHLFGTDTYGRDVFARIVHGSRASLSIGLLTTIIAVFVGGIFGSIAGFYGGMADSVIMRVMDTIMAIPPILLALAIVASLGPGMTNLIIAMTISSVPGFTRIIQAVILLVVEQDYVEAARACGTKDIRIILRHILPNSMGPIIVQATMSVASMIISAASLSFLGMGIQPPTPEWGAMLSESREYMTYAPYLVIIPGLAILLSALALNLFGDGLRDALDPRLKD